MGFFKAYDMRGTFGVDFDLETVQRVGLALPKVVPGRRWLVGRDCRVTSNEVRDALVRGLSAAGVEVTDLGQCTTPMVYYFTAEGDFDGSVMITASHNPPSDNGLKVSKRTALPVGYANGLKEVEEEVRGKVKGEGQGQGSWEKAKGEGQGQEERSGAKERYIAWMKERMPDLSGIKIGIDCSNGMASILVKELFPGAVIINDTLDGRFPNHSPNPLKAEAREQIAALVKAKALDCGVIFDGDADRCMFVDEQGNFVQPDYLIPIVAHATGIGKVTHDVRTSRGAIEELKRIGCEPVMVPVGHAFAKPIIRESGATCGGELAGHYYFKEFFGCDSGVLAALRILGEIAKAKAGGKTFSQMMAPISGVYANSGELNFKVDDKDAAIARVLKVAKDKLSVEQSRSEIDGIRLEYDEGWVNIRKSNTEPYLRLIVECDTRERLAMWTGLFKAAIETHDC